MRFDRLRLNGFKSFVDPTDLVIREGLTGVVGPNGCGKSNLLEALRWVMGENRPTAMRGEGMEDVIFAGTARRPARAQAEVVLTIDNRDHLAPAGFNADDHIDITRRITRDAGSAYRINGREVRARDVQMLFADASTGAHSPALVRQGQISELINAKPKARRRILEEAAGISGLYQRRHEAELKLNGAETNLTRVDDTLDQLGAQAASLARQARAAAKYREIGAALRQAEGALLFRRWAEADAARAAAAEALSAATSAAVVAEAAARAATGLREQAESMLPPLREEEQIASAVLSRLLVEAEALDEAESRAADAIEALGKRIAQLDRDIDRETALNRDAGQMVERLAWEKAEIDKAHHGHEARLTEAGTVADQAAEALTAMETKLAELTGASARLDAQHQSAQRLAGDLREMQTRASHAADQAETAATRATEAGTAAETALQQAEAVQSDARTQAETAEATLSAAETARAEAEVTESQARAARAGAEGEAAALAAEMAALRRLVDRGRAGGDAVLDQITVAPGYEAALGAALGDDLRAGLTDTGSGWHSLPPLDPVQPLPSGAAPLAPHVTAPPALARRLSQVGIAGGNAAALQAGLRPGQRLVTQGGDLYRWDGLRVMAGEASSSAALHLQKVNELKAITAQADTAARAAETAAATHEVARAALTDAAGAEKTARDTRRDADRALSDAARAVSRAESDLSLARSRAESARAELARHRADAADAGARLAQADRALADLPDRAAAAEAVEHARTGVEAARIATLSRRSALDELRREGNARIKRLQEIAKESSGWQLRLTDAGTRAAELSARRDAAATELTTAQAQPAELATRRASLTERQALADTRQTRARAALDSADMALRDAAQAERDAERAASDAREDRASRQARSDAARDGETVARARIAEETDGGTPDSLRATLDDAATETPAAALEDQIARLRSQRDGLGAVNLRADQDKQELETERDRLAGEKADLVEAIHKLRAGIGSLNREGRERLLAAFDTVNSNFSTLFTTLFGGGEARLVLVESDDPLEAGLEIMCQPPGKKLATLSLLSGGEQTLTALALIFAVFLANPAPICVLDEVDAPLDDANVSRFCDMLDEMTRRTDTRFLIITHHAVTMSRMDRLFGVTMVEQGVSQLVSVDLKRAEALVA
ncbi:MAG: AAA family ATPase [Paracoccus sp. (in: a-proteobacteria)]|uniref:chromosome segregation SMC family protein n=1 Tax=Paracoccus sp. TaxID=267 RepID=UPI0026DF211C|nr:AAA family ATPase [Paracoccus sp. (in: a-proteobacteria)]MDO5630873.1 AAA family ATPase [Paracoccus sp. (in: a-proteobacteria)]